MKRYVENYQTEMNNPDPQIRVVQDGPGTAMLTGDGGLGIIVGEQAMRLAISKAKQTGVAAVTTTYHDHIGSAGKYVRMVSTSAFLAENVYLQACRRPMCVAQGDIWWC